MWSSRWVVYEYGFFKGRQKLLQPGEFPAWGDHSGWDTIGSLYPLKQVRPGPRVPLPLLLSQSISTAEVTQTRAQCYSSAHYCLLSVCISNRTRVLVMSSLRHASFFHLPEWNVGLYRSFYILSRYCLGVLLNCICHVSVMSRLSHSSRLRLAGLVRYQPTVLRASTSSAVIGFHIILSFFM